MSLLDKLPNGGKRKIKQPVSESLAGQIGSSQVTPADYSSQSAAPLNSKPISLLDKLKAKPRPPQAGLTLHFDANDTSNVKFHPDGSIAEISGTPMGAESGPKQDNRVVPSPLPAAEAVPQLTAPEHPAKLEARNSPAVAIPPASVSAPSLTDKLKRQIKETAPVAERTHKPISSEAITPTQPEHNLPPPIEQAESSLPEYIPSGETLAAKIARMKKADLEIDTAFEPSLTSTEADELEMLDRYGNPITLNDKQKEAVDMALSGQSFVLTGEAGTGKSTTIEAVLLSLLKHHREKINEIDYRMGDRTGRRIPGPSCCVAAYTRKAIGNVARIISHNFELHAEMEGALQTIHNLLEYAPVIQWSEKQEREVRIFKPSRGKWAPLDVSHLVVEEASTLGLDLKSELFDALQAGVQIIYVGDINQLPPVFGKSVMSYALVKLPIVHLDVVYRQALDNPIIAAAHAVLHGQEFEAVAPAVKWLKGKKNVAQPEETMSRAMGTFFDQAIKNRQTIEKWYSDRETWDMLSLEDRKAHLVASPDSKPPRTIEEIEAESKTKYIYDPEEDIVLIPFNKNAMGTKQINYRIAQILGEERQAEVFEIIAGFEKHYLAIGDRVLVNKMEGKITIIRGNMNYMGKPPMKSSVNLSRFGFYVGTAAEQADSVLNGEADLDELDELDMSATIDENEERRQASSHSVTIELETGQEITINSAGEFNGQIFQLGYALSVHKSQGSEWKRVFLLFHKNHAPMLSRELLYTAMTRAREELVIISRPELIRRGINNPRIKGNSLAEKIEFFNSGYLDEDIEVTV